MKLCSLVTEARVLVETPAAPELPYAIRWILAHARKDPKARAKLLDRAEAAMESRVESLIDVPDHSPRRVLAPKGRGKKAVAPAAPVAPAPPPKAARELHTLTPEDIVADVIAYGNREAADLVSPVLETLADEPLETFMIDTLNDQHSLDVGPWHFNTTSTNGVFTVNMKLAGREQDADTEVPVYDDINTDKLERGFTQTLGASTANFRWHMDTTPSSWGYTSGDKAVVSFDGKATWKFNEGDALRFALGAKALLDVATKVLAAAAKQAS